MKNAQIWRMIIIFALAIFVNTTLADERVIHEKTFKTEFGKNLKLNTSSGDVYVSTWDKPEVYVKISGNRKAKDKINFKFQNDDEGVEITAKRDSWMNFFSWSGIYLKYEIKLPKNYNAYISTAGGDIKLYDVKGELRLETSGGDVFVKGTNGKNSISTSGGDIISENSQGTLDVSTSGGDIRVKSFDGDVSASTSGGDIVLMGKNGKINASTSGGDVSLDLISDMNEGIELSTTGGDIQVRVPGNFAANVDLSTTGGDVECDIPLTSKGKISASRIRGEINGGGKMLDCSTTGGDIHLYKK